MDKRLAQLISALGPIMNPIQAEGFLHVTAFTFNKSLETLSAEDWPGIEVAVREALASTSSQQDVEAVLSRMREAFLGRSEGTAC